MDETESLILDFIKNRNESGESTTLRHVHRRFGIEYDEAESLMTKLTENNLIESYYDDEYEEYRYIPH